MGITLIPISESPEQVGRVLSWALELWGNRYPNYSRQDWANFYSHSVRSDYGKWQGDGQELVYIAVQNGDVVATIGLVDFDELEEFRELTPWIAAFIVNPEFRGQGIGGQVLELLENKASSLGIEVLHLWTEDQANFYRKRGYRLIAASRLGSLSIDVMAKRLE